MRRGVLLLVLLAACEERRRQDVPLHLEIEDPRPVPAAPTLAAAPPPPPRIRPTLALPAEVGLPMFLVGFEPFAKMVDLAVPIGALFVFRSEHGSTTYSTPVASVHAELIEERARFVGVRFRFSTRDSAARATAVWPEPVRTADETRWSSSAWSATLRTTELTIRANVPARSLATAEVFSLLGTLLGAPLDEASRRIGGRTESADIQVGDAEAATARQGHAFIRVDWDTETWTVTLVPDERDRVAEVVAHGSVGRGDARRRMLFGALATTFGEPTPGVSPEGRAGLRYEAEKTRVFVREEAAKNTFEITIRR